jgi:BlaI family penicillinase repressor
MDRLPEISEAEHQVMKLIWGDHPITAMEIIRELTRTTDWKPNTIKTFINRLLKKGAVGFEKSGKEYNYYPLIEEADFVKSESRLFLNRIFGGSLKPMLLAMVENEDLTLEDIEDLRGRILEKGQEES